MEKHSVVSLIGARGVSLLFYNYDKLVRCDHVFPGAAENGILRSIRNWKQYGQLPKQVVM